MDLRRIAFLLPFVAALAASGCATTPSVKHDAHLRSTPDTVVRGHVPAGRKPVLTIKSGQIVRIDTLSHQGITRMDPVAFFGQAGIAPNEVLADAIEISRKVPLPKGGSVHVLTGPIYVEGAEPGDMREVRILHLDFRVPYGVNNSNKGRMDVDLDVALKEAAQETIAFLGQERGLTPADAYSLASIAVDYGVAEAVDHVLLIYGAIPKKLFSTNRPYWGAR